MLKRIKNYYKKRENERYSTDENRRTIYYPFNKPGEAYYVDENQRKKAEILSTYYPIAYGLLIILPLTLSFELLPRHYYFTLSTICFGPVLILYYLKIRRFTDTLEPYPCKQTKTPDFFYKLLILLLLQILIISLTYIYTFPLAPVFIGMLLVWHFAFLIIVTIAAYRTLKPVLQARKEDARRR